MLLVDIKPLLSRLNDYAKSSLETSVSFCMNRRNYEVTIEHWVLKLLENPQSDLPIILRHYEIDIEELRRLLIRTLDTLSDGNSARPVISPLLFELVQDAWLLASIDYRSRQVRSGMLLFALLVRFKYLSNANYQHLFSHINRDQFAKEFEKITENSLEAKMQTEVPVGEAEGRVMGEGQPIQQFCEDITKKARDGKIDPVFGRDHEIRQMVDVLVRRRKNNPILVGEPGVGKTAVVEGLARRIAEGDVPDRLKPVTILNLDLSLLEAGASLKGEFEKRLKSVIDAVKASTTPIILFIDEAHMLVGAGGQAGGSDAANILKPALARGELRTIAATTWAEYKKYFEKDAALERRFLPIKLDEPSVHSTTLILRGLKPHYEKSHNVVIRDEAIVAAADLAKKYIAGRFLPDKAIDLVDTCAGRISVNLGAKPARLEDKERAMQALEREKAALIREKHYDTSGEENPRIAEIEAELVVLAKETKEIEKQWSAERDLVKAIIELREQIEKSETDEEKHKIKAEIKVKEDELKAVQLKHPLVQYEVTADLVARVISDWTGIPLGKVLRDEATAMLQLNQRLRETIKGQDQAIEIVAEGIKAAKAGLKLPTQPMGVFLLVGPSGVGKTETALAVAETLFGGRDSLITINMSEFQEKHSVSRLIGSPPGYVGYGEGGMLTEAVRQRPYSVVLLDEVEKAHLDVMNLFYQVFDKGVLSDGEGREIDFKNTVLFLTSNLGSETIIDLCDPESPPSHDKVIDGIYPILSGHFKPALLNRMTVVPYYALTKDALRDIAKIKIRGLQDRMLEGSGFELNYSPSVLQYVVDTCQRGELGARAIDGIINRQMIPELAAKVLESMGQPTEYNTIYVDITQAQKFVYTASHQDRSEGKKGNGVEEEMPVKKKTKAKTATGTSKPGASPHL